MTPPRGDGLYMRRDHYGDVTCPHCQATVGKVNASQITCGSMSCRSKQNKARAKVLKLLRQVAAE